MGTGGGRGEGFIVTLRVRVQSGVWKLFLGCGSHYWNIESHPTGTVLKCGNVVGRKDHSRAWKNLFLECNYVAMRHSHAEGASSWNTLWNYRGKL